MKEVSFFLERLKLYQAKEFEKDVRILVDMKKYNDMLRCESTTVSTCSTRCNTFSEILENSDKEEKVGRSDEELEGETKRENNKERCNEGYKGKQNGKKKEEESYNKKWFGDCINYVYNVYKECQFRSPFDHSYYLNIVQCYDHIMLVNTMGSTDNTFNILFSNTTMNSNGSVTNEKISNDNARTNKVSTYERNQNLIIFFHMYLIRRYCEKNFLYALHSRFIRSILYNYIERTSFLKYIEQDIYFLHCYIQIYGYILLKNRKCDLQVVHIVLESLKFINEELDGLKKYLGINTIEEAIKRPHFTPSNSLIKYIYFITEFIAKNPQCDFINIMFGAFSCVSVFANIYYLCSLCYNTSNIKLKTKVENTQETKPESVITYHDYISKYADPNCMNFNELFLYFISQKKLNESKQITVSSIYKDLQICNYTTFLEKLFFIENSVTYPSEYDKEPFRSIKTHILRHIFTFHETAPLKLNLSTMQNKKRVEKKDTPLQRGVQTEVQAEVQTEVQARMQKQEKEAEKRSTNEYENEGDVHNSSRNMKTENGKLCGRTPFFYLEEQKRRNHTNEDADNTDITDNADDDYDDDRASCIKDINQDYAEAKYTLDTDFFKKFYKGTKYMANTNEVNNLSKHIEEQKNYFLKIFNDNFEDSSNYFACIDYFCYIGIDFDKTITVKDSYSYLHKMIIECYGEPVVKKVQLTLTEEEIHFFDNILTVSWEGKKEFSKEERILYLAKINRWFSLKEEEILQELQNKKDVSNIYDESYSHFLQLIDHLNYRYTALTSYYDLVKDVEIDKLNQAIFEKYEDLKLRDYFLNFFLNAVNYKQKRKERDFYFDVITLNCMETLCLSAIKNNLKKTILANVDADDGVVCFKGKEEKGKEKDKEKEKQNDIMSRNGNDHGNNNINDDGEWFQKIKKHFNIYYSKSYECDKEKVKYTGFIDNMELEIHSSNYSDDTKVEKMRFRSLYDKTKILKTVHSFIKNKNNKLTCFIGDSLYDLDVLLSVDIPIIIGRCKMLSVFCEKHNIVIKPLILAAAKLEYIVNTNQKKREPMEQINMLQRLHNLKNERNEALVDIFDEHKKVFYSAQGWLEIGIFFFGNQF